MYVYTYTHCISCMVFEYIRCFNCSHISVLNIWEQQDILQKNNKPEKRT